MKKPWIYVAVGAGALLLFGAKKAVDVSNIVDNMEFEFEDIAGVSLEALPNLKFKAKFSILNNTDIDFGANFSSKISVREIRVFNYQGSYIGKAQTNLYQLELPARQKTILPWMDMTVDAIKAFGEVSTNYFAYFQGDYSNLRYEVDLNIFGKTVTLDA